MVGIALYAPVADVKSVEPTQEMAANFSSDLEVKRIYDVEERDISSREKTMGEILKLKREPNRVNTFSRVRESRKEIIPIMNPLLRVCQ